METKKVISLCKRDDETRVDFMKRVARRLYDGSCDYAEYISGSACERFYRKGESVSSHTFYVYEVDESGNWVRMPEED